MSGVRSRWRSAGRPGPPCGGGTCSTGRCGAIAGGERVLRCAADPCPCSKTTRCACEPWDRAAEETFCGVCDAEMVAGTSPARCISGDVAGGGEPAS